MIGIWSPNTTPQPLRRQYTSDNQSRYQSEPSLVQQSPTVDRKEFRSVKFESPLLPRKVYVCVNSINLIRNIPFKLW